MDSQIHKKISRLLKTNILDNQSYIENYVSNQNSATPAAVLLPIIQYENHETVLLTQRAKDLTHHAGQISFPGGCIDSSDSSPLECALRETQEEVGIAPEAVHVLGQMGEWLSYTGFSISVFIGIIKAPVHYQLCEREVAETIEIPTSFLFNPTQYEKVSLCLEEQQRSFYQTHYAGKKIWGFTGGIMYLLSKLLSEQN
jgi:8-oxo-dGTP pyrophosphatase MutT (NUDIX family)